MHEIRSCDFCGQDATGTYEIVPPELEPTEAEQRRVALCPGCKGQLEELIEPLLARASGAETAKPASSGGSRGVRSSIGGDTSGEGRSKRLPSVMETNDDQPAAGQPSARRASDGDSNTDEAEGGRTSTDRSSASRSSGGETDASEESGGEANAGEASSTAAGDGGASTSQTSANGGATSEQRGGSGDAVTTTRPLPAKYGAVMRLLSNREFPVKRPAVEDLAASAYDLEDDEVQEILEYAIEVGDFVAEGDQLRKP